MSADHADTAREQIAAERAMAAAHNARPAGEAKVVAQPEGETNGKQFPQTGDIEDGRFVLQLTAEAPRDQFVDGVLHGVADRNDGPWPSLFVRSGQLARLITDENGQPRLQSVTDDAVMRTVLAAFVRLYQLKRDKAGKWRCEAAWPPRELLQSLRTLGHWPGLPAIEAIVETPTLRVDGTILDTPGYDEDARLYYAPAPNLTIPSVPDKPTAADLSTALGLLRSDLLGDFPFASPADEANALALLLTPIVRPSLRCVPLALLDAPRAGTGKGLLASVAARIATGRAAGVFPAPDDDREWGKSITSMLDAGTTFILIDEARDLRSPRLSAALTADSYTDRRLGHSEMIDVPQRATWAAAGNNIALGGDLPRRCYRIRLDPKVARPWTRNGWRHPDLEGWVAQHRGKLLGALLTIARAWHAAGRPEGRVPTLGGFAEWAETIGGILTHAGTTGFLTNLPDLYDQGDDDASQWEAFLTTLAAATDGKPFTTGHVATLIDHGPIRDTLPDELAPKLMTAGFKVALGKALRARVDTRHGEHGLHLIHAGTDQRTKVPRWRVATDPPAGGAGDYGGSEPSHMHARPAPARTRAYARDVNPPQPPAPPAGGDSATGSATVEKAS